MCCCHCKYSILGYHLLCERQRVFATKMYHKINDFIDKLSLEADSHNLFFLFAEGQQGLSTVLLLNCLYCIHHCSCK